MPSLDDIFGVLTASDKQIAEEDPYDDYGDLATSIMQKVFNPREVEVTDSWGNHPTKMKTAAPTLGEALITGLVGGATRGFFGGLSEDYRTSQRDLARKTLVDALEGGELTRPEGLGGNIWTNIADNASAFRLQRKFGEQDENQKAARALESAVQLKRLTDPLSSGESGAVKAEYTPEGLKVTSLPTTVPVADTNIGPFTDPERYAAALAGPSTGTVGANPLRSALKKAMLGQDMTDAEASAMSGAPLEVQGRFAQYRQQHDVGERAAERMGLNRDQFGMRKSQLEIPGYEPAGDLLPTPTEAAKLREELAETATLRTAMTELAQNIDQNGALKAFGNDAKMQGALASFARNTFRKIPSNMGARLEGPEARMMNAMSPDVFELDPVGAMKSLMMGRDPAQFARDMMAFVDRAEDAKMAARGFSRRAQDVKLPTGNAIEVPGAVPTTSTITPRPRMSFEEWKKSRGK